MILLGADVKTPSLFLMDFAPPMGTIPRTIRPSKENGRGKVFATNHGIGKQPITGPDQLKQMTFSCLKKVQKLPSLIRSFFAMPETIYTGNC